MPATPEPAIPELPRTIAELPFFASGRFPRPDLVGRADATGIRMTGGRELLERVRDLSLGLATLGLGRGDRVALLAESRPEWLCSDFAILAMGAVTVPVYPTLSPEQIGFILHDSGARAVIVSNAALLEKLRGALGQAPGVATVVLMDPLAAGEPAPPDLARPVRSLHEVAQAGHERIRGGWGVAREFHDAARAVQPADLATIVYTSGTTGVPKGVRLTHGNLVANLDGIQRVLRLGTDDTALSFLPLCHSFERMVAYVYLTNGVSMVFAESMDTVPRDLTRVRPTIMTAVPRVFEKLYDRVLATGREATGLRRWVFERAVVLARARGRAITDERPFTLAERLWSRVAEPMVYTRIRAALGGRLRFVVSGSAPLRPDLGAFFFGIGVPILEGYGLTETAPVVCVTPLEHPRLGRVGRPLPNVEVRVAADGELLVRGPNVMAGYHNRPDDTAAAIVDGWFHTGDIGAIDAEGYVAITDRKKEVLITSGGKKVAPQPLEAALAASPLVTAAVVVGEQRRFPAALIVPDFARLAEALGEPPPPDDAARARLAADPRAHARIQAVVDEVNHPLAQFERLKKFVLLPRDLSMDTGELTPTLKLRRRVVAERWRDEIESLYA
ncbi:MAG: long-chain fatty acid--CoA ligase [Vicinamibacterales bacterium]